MANYKALFRGWDRDPLSENETGTTIGYEYRVDFIGNSGSTSYTDIKLAGSSPVILNYDVCNTPFDPVRYSQLQINVVCDSYLEDILASEPMQTRVRLRNVTLDNKVLFDGWLVPMVLSADYRDEYETFQLQANDCLKVLQYLPYELKTPESGITFVSFKDILEQICTRSGGLVNYYFWPQTKKIDNVVVGPENLVISEKNWYYSDVEETIKLDEVLEEICKYFGVTAYQQGSEVYFVDYKGIDTSASFRRYSKTGTRGNLYTIGSAVTMTQDYVVGPTPSITIEPLRNKIEVRDNFYTAEYFVPSPFDDEHLTNRLDEDNFYYTKEIKFYEPRAPKYPDGATWVFWQKYTEDKIEDKKHPENNEDDSSYRYFHRVYDHDMWESVYRTKSAPGTDLVIKPTTNYHTYYVGGTIVDHASVREDYRNEYSQTIVANKRDFTRYLMIRQDDMGIFPIDFGYDQYGQFYPQLTQPQDRCVFRLKPGYKANVAVASNSYLVIDGSAIFERYDRPYIRPSWTTEGNKIKWNASGSRTAATGTLAFCVGIGGKYWNGSSWQTTKCRFWVPLKRSQEEYPVWNSDLEILNNVRWDLFINADGYKIPLNGVDTTGEITFEVHLPSLQWYFSGADWNYNGFCWIKDLSVKVYREGQDADMTEEESDYVVTNVINAGSVQEMNAIEFKITTATDASNPAWSDCIYSGSTKHLVSEVVETAMGITGNTPEMNTVQKYVDQYSVLTKRISYQVPLTFQMYDRFTGIDVENPSDLYVALGTEIDFKEGTQRLEMIKRN